MMINRLLDGFFGKLTSSRWALLTKTSQDTASRDIGDLLEKGILMRGSPGGRSTSYELVLPAGHRPNREEIGQSFVKRE